MIIRLKDNKTGYVYAFTSLRNLIMNPPKAFKLPSVFLWRKKRL